MAAPRILIAAAALLGLATSASAQGHDGAVANDIDSSGSGTVTVVPGNASGDVSTGSSGSLNSAGRDSARGEASDSKAGTTGTTQIH